MGSFLTQVDGFTPVIDILIQEIGLIPAVVYGRVWRYCQGRDHVCRASLDTIATEIGLSPRTVLRHIKELCEAEYLDDTTPDLRNRPHVYRDTGRAKIVGMVSAVTESHTDRESQYYDRESYLGMTESHSTMTESQLKRQVKIQEEDTVEEKGDVANNDDVSCAEKEKEQPQPLPINELRDDPIVGPVYETWEAANGMLTPMEAQLIGAQIDEYGAETVRDAIMEAARCTKHFAPKYVDRILERWRRDGRGDRASPAQTQYTKRDDGSIEMPVG